MNLSGEVKFQFIPNQSIKIHFGVLPEMFQVEAYPNPAIDKIQFRTSSSLSGNLNISIYDLDGNLVFNVNGLVGIGQSIWDWDLRDIRGNLLPDGLFFCKIKLEDKEEKFIKLIIRN